MSFLFFTTSGSGSYFGLIKRGINGQVWNGSGSEAWNSSDYASYQVGVTQDGVSGGWKCQLPSGLPVNELLWFIPVQNNGSEQADVQDDPRPFGVDPNGNVLLPVNAVDAAGKPIVWSSNQPSGGAINTIASGGPLRLVQGGAFKVAGGNQIDITKPPNALWPADLSGFSSFTLTLTKAIDNPNALPVGGQDPASFAGTVIVATGAGQTVRFELTSAQTALLALGVGTQGYNFKLTAMSGVDTYVLMEGQCTVTT